MKCETNCNRSASRKLKQLSQKCGKSYSLELNHDHFDGSGFGFGREADFTVVVIRFEYIRGKKSDF